MDQIELRGLTFYGYHGVLPPEQQLGQRFVVDITLGLSLEAAGRADALDLTVNYAEVAELARVIVEGPPFKLIEALAARLADATLSGFPLVQAVTVRVSKPSAPISQVPTADVAVQIFRARTPERHVSEGMQSGVLSADALRALIGADPPLVSPLSEPEQQIQPNGVDLTLESVWRIEQAGALGLSNADRVVPERLSLEPDEDGWYVLAPGAYIIRLHETVAIPRDLMAFGRPRSSLLRCAAALHTAVWDAGYRGRSESLLMVYGAAGVRLQRGARVIQLVFLRLDRQTEAYAGVYQGENVTA